MRSVLSELHQLNESQEKLEKLKIELNSIEKELEISQSVSNSYFSCNQKLELSKHAMLLLRRKIESTSAHQLIENINQLEILIPEIKERLLVVNKNILSLEEKIQQIEERIENFESSKDKQLKIIQEEINSAKKRETQLRNEMRKAQEKSGIANAEFSELQEEHKLLTTDRKSVV